MRSKIKLVALLLSVTLVSCAEKLPAKLERCADGDCRVVARFGTLQDCKQYSILWFSHINYHELLSKGSTVIKYEIKTDDGQLSCRE